MHENNIISLREHHFYVALAKHIFSHEERGIVFVRDTIKIEDAAKFGLKPLIMYGITVPGTQIKWYTFSPVDCPRSFLSVLQDAWNDVSGLRGYPDILKINRHVAGACPGLSNTLQQHNVSVIVADTKDKLLSSSLRVAQQGGLELGWYIDKEEHAFAGVDDLNAHAMNCHNRDVKNRKLHYIGDKVIEKRGDQWLGLDHRSIDLSLPESLDWTPGNWLSTWEINVPHCTQRYFLEDEGGVWLITGEDSEAHSSIEDGSDDLDDGYEMDYELDNYVAEKAKLLVDCWPNGPAGIARAVGITVKELQWFLTNRTDLPNAEKGRLFDLLGLICDIGDTGYEADGPYVLVAESPKKISAGYDEISRGGDIEFSFEVLPEKGSADPSWRYLLFNAYGGLFNIIMIPRGSKVSERVDDDLFINFQGEKKVPAARYRDIVAVCARACGDPWLNRQLMTEFNMTFGSNLLNIFDKVI